MNKELDNHFAWQALEVHRRAGSLFARSSDHPLTRSVVLSITRSPDRPIVAIALVEANSVEGIPGGHVGKHDPVARLQPLQNFHCVD